MAVLQSRYRVLVSGLLLVAVVAWSYGAAMAGMAIQWWTNPDYLYGFLVLPFAGFLLWWRRGMLQGGCPQGSLWGIVLIVLAAAMRCGAAYASDRVVEALSLVPCLGGVALIAGGWTAARWAWPSVAFLAFMVPLPSFVASWINSRLQEVATIAATHLLQTFNVPAVAEGNVIALSQADLGVVDACGGLRMVMLFLAISVAAAFLVQNRADKVIILASAIPVTVLANVIRITVTGVVYELSDPTLAHGGVHDLVGFFMMPLAVAMIWGETAILRRLFVVVPTSQPLSVNITS